MKKIINHLKIVNTYDIMKLINKGAKTMQIYDLIIIGGGPSGYSAALYGARAGLSTLVIEKETIGGQMAITDIIDNYPGFEKGIQGIELGFKMQEGAERFGSKTEYDQVLSVDFSGAIKKVKTNMGEMQAYAVIIATGANPRALNIVGEKENIGKGVHYCAHCDGRFYKDKTVVVVGGGNTAVNDALYLSNLASKVYLVHRRNEFRADKIYLDTLEKSNNIEKITPAQIKEIIADNKVNSVKIEQNGEEKIIETDAVFVSIGRNPASEIFDTITKDKQGYIKAKEDTKTNIDGVYAVGDVRTKPVRQVVTAVSDGATAVHFAQEYIAKIK